MATLLKICYNITPSSKQPGILLKMLMIQVTSIIPFLTFQSFAWLNFFWLWFLQPRTLWDNRLIFFWHQVLSLAQHWCNRCWWKRCDHSPEHVLIAHIYSCLSTRDWDITMILFCIIYICICICILYYLDLYCCHWNMIYWAYQQSLQSGIPCFDK